MTASDLEPQFSSSNNSRMRRLFQRIILHKLCIIKINLCIFKCEIVYL